MATYAELARRHRQLATEGSELSSQLGLVISDLENRYGRGWVQDAPLAEYQRARQVEERCAEILTECRSLEAQIEALESQDRALKGARPSEKDIDMTKLEHGADEETRNGAPPQAMRRTGNPWASPVGVMTPPSTIRSRALAAIEATPHAPDEGRQTITSLIERHAAAGLDREADLASRWALATSNPEYVSAFFKVAKDPQRGHLEFSTAELEAWRAVRAVQADRAMSLTDTQGGYLVPFDLDPSVIVTDGGASNAIGGLARRVTAIGDVWNGVSATSVSWSFDAEAAEVSDDAPTFASPSITIRTARGFVPISLEAYLDGANVTETVARLLADGRSELEARVLVNGVAASNEPVGIVTALTGTAAEITGTGESLAAGGAGAITDVYNLLNGLAPRWRGSAQWVLDDTTLQAISRLVPPGSTTDVPLVGGGQQILNKRYAIHSHMDDLQLATVTATTRPLVVGDWSQYVIATRIGMTVEFVQNLVGPNHRPTGQKGWFAYNRFGAGLTSGPAATGPLRMLKVVTAA